MKLGFGYRLGALSAVLLGALSIGAARADLLYVTSFNNNTIGEYNATTEATVDAALVSGLGNPQFIAIQAAPAAVPEPGTLALLGAGLACRRRRRAARG